MWRKSLEKPTQPRTKSPEQALSSLMAMCARAERSSGDARRLMTRWGVAPADQERVLQRLIDERFIDDARYAAAFIRDKSRFNGWGEYKISSELSRKGVSREIINDAMESLSNEDLKDQLQKIMERKVRSVKCENSMQLRDKLMRFGLSRGYSMNLVREVIGEVVSVNEE